MDPSTLFVIILVAFFAGDLLSGRVYYLQEDAKEVSPILKRICGLIFLLWVMLYCAVGKNVDNPLLSFVEAVWFFFFGALRRALKNAKVPRAESSFQVADPDVMAIESCDNAHLCLIRCGSEDMDPNLMVVEPGDRINPGGFEDPQLNRWMNFGK